MATNITSSSLDFNEIKENLKTYLASKDEFKDYDFEASGLNNILDVLAYNTHFNGLIANFATNESFLNTSQLRSSVVSHAEKLGYRARSKTASRSSVTVYANLSALSPRPTRIMLPAETVFTASNDENSYNFMTLENYYAEDDGSGFYVFSNDTGSSFIDVYEGEMVSKTFIVDRNSEDPVFVIPDPNVDTKTVKVKVYESPNTTRYENYEPVSEAILLDKESTFFDIKESPNGFFELNFGDGITFGKTPVAGNKIVVTYLSTNGESANGSSGFTPRRQLTVNEDRFNLSVSSQNLSASGSDKESIESVRKLAPLQFAAQKRLVTPLDYKSMILQNYPVVRDVAAWGGEDNVPIDYGKAYISVQYVDGTTTQIKESTQESIAANFTNQLSIMSIRNEFVDPMETYLELIGNFNFDPTVTSKSPTTLQNLVQNYIIEYFDRNLNRFDQEFRRSNVLAGIDSLDQAIISSKLDVKLSQRVNVELGVKRNYDIYFPVRLSPPDRDDHIVQSAPFLFGESNLRQALIRNKLGSNVLQVTTPSGEVLLDNVGYYESKLGRIRLNGFQPDTILNGLTYLKFISTPLDQSVIAPLRNYVLRVDTNTLFVQPIRNLSETKVNL